MAKAKQGRVVGGFVPLRKSITIEVYASKNRVGLRFKTML